jgi:hypothetical protein
MCISLHQRNIYLQILILYNYLHPITDRTIKVKFVQELDMNLTLVQNDLCLRCLSQQITLSKMGLKPASLSSCDRKHIKYAIIYL